MSEEQPQAATPSESTTTSPETQAQTAGAQGQEQQPKQETVSTEQKQEATTQSEGEDSKPKRESGSQRQKRRIAQLEAELMQVRLGGSQERQSKPADPEPQEKDFPDWHSYDKAHRSWETGQAVKRVFDEHDKRAQAREVAEQRREIMLDHEERIENFRSKVPDFDEVVGKMRGVNVKDEVMFDIMDSEKSDLIVYHLAKNPEKIRELNSMSERERAKEIGRLEGSLRMPASKKETQAGKPLTEIKGAAAASPDPSSMSMDEYVEWRRKGGGVRSA